MDRDLFDHIVAGAVVGLLVSIMFELTQIEGILRQLVR